MNIYCRRTVLGHLLRLTLIVVLCFLVMPTPANGKKKKHGPYWEWKIKGNMQALGKRKGQAGAYTIQIYCQQEREIQKMGGQNDALL